MATKVPFEAGDYLIFRSKVTQCNYGGLIILEAVGEPVRCTGSLLYVTCQTLFCNYRHFPEFDVRIIQAHTLDKQKDI